MKQFTVIVNEKNQEKIEALIKEAEGRCKERTVTFSSVLKAIECIEYKYRDTKKKNWEGLVINCDVNAQDFPKAYKYTPRSTQFTLTRQGGKWRVSGFHRGICNGSAREYRVEKMPEELKQNIIEAYCAW